MLKIYQKDLVLILMIQFNKYKVDDDLTPWSNLDSRLFYGIFPFWYMTTLCLIKGTSVEQLKKHSPEEVKVGSFQVVIFNSLFFSLADENIL